MIRPQPVRLTGDWHVVPSSGDPSLVFCCCCTRYADQPKFFSSGRYRWYAVTNSIALRLK